MAAAGFSADATPARRRRGGWRSTLLLAARTPRGAAGLTLSLLLGLLALLGPLFEPHSPTAFQTLPFASPSGGYPLGTDVLARDVLSRILAGGQILLVMAIAATALGILLGSAAGLWAAYLQGRADGLIMRTVDVLLAFPQLVFALLLVSIVGPKLWVIVVAVGLGHAPQVARVLRAAALDVAERPFVKAVELQGVARRRILVSEILPNLVTPLMVETGLRLTSSIVVMAGLAFLGFGQAPPAANWGIMINENRVGLASNPWAVIVPSVLIALLAIGVNTFADAIARVAIGVDRGSVQDVVLLEAASRAEVTA